MNKITLEQSMLGELKQEIVEQGVYLPKKFQFSKEWMTMLVLQEKDWISLQLHKKLDQETKVMLEEEHITILSEERIEIGEEGYLKFPEAFLEKVGDSESVVVTGMMDCVEIITIAEYVELARDLAALEQQLQELWEF